MTLHSPVGLAPGFDKNGDLVAGLDTLGFGYLVIGSVTRHPRPGNPKPRMATVSGSRVAGQQPRSPQPRAR